MYRKKSMIILVMLALSLTLIPSVYAAEYPIDNVIIVKDLPENLVAGNTYEMIITFENVAEAPIPIIIEITVTCEEAPLNTGEIIVESIYLNEGELFSIEVNAGVFSIEEGVLEAESSNELIVTISSLINLMPGTYKFEINLSGEKFSYIIEVPANTPTTIDAMEEAGVVLEDFNSTEPATVTITLLDENPHPEAEVPPNSPMAMGIFLEFEANVTEFTAEIRVYYTDADVVAAGIDEGSLRLYYFNETLEEWVQCEDTGVNTVENYIWARVTHFTVFSPWGVAVTEPEEPEPAVFVVMELAVSPSTVHPGGNVAVRVVLANVGEEAGVHELELFINGIFEASETVTLEGGVSTIVTFTVAREDVGVYLVEVHGLQGSFTVIPEVFPIPAEFIISNLAISPSTVHPGDIVTVTVALANVGEEAGVHVVELLINGTVVASEPVTLGGGESRTVTFTVAREDVGVYLVEVDGLQGSFTVIPEVFPIPAEFIVKALTISPATAYTDETVTVRVEVENVGEEAGEYTVELLINGDFEASEIVSLGGGESTAVTFTVAKDVGAYLVEVDGLQGSFTVIPEVQPIPAEFEYSNLSIAPTEVEVGELVNVSVTVTNVGELEGVCDVSLLVNGTVEAVESVTLIGGEVVDVIFTLTAGELGTYIVSIDGLEGIFTVVAPPTDLTPYLILLLIIIIVLIVLFKRLKK